MLLRWRKFYSKNYRPPSIVQAPIPRIYHVVIGQLASVVAWAGIYIDVGVDLNEKHAIICRKTVLIPSEENFVSKIVAHWPSLFL